MTKTADALLRDALELGEQDRADMAVALLESLEPAVDEAEIARAWDEEVARRVAEIDSGQAEMIPWEEVRKRLLSGLHEQT